MKRWTVLSVILVVGVLGACLAAQRPAEFSVERLAENLAVIKDTNDGNTAVFIRNDGVVLVDTKSLKAGQQLLEVLRTVTTKPVTHILHTHHHYDHTGGNSFFPAHVEVIAHENAAKRMPEMTEFNTPEVQALADHILQLVDGKNWDPVRLATQEKIAAEAQLERPVGNAPRDEFIAKVASSEPGEV